MQIPYEVTARPDTGLYNAKVGIWLFLASEVMLFGGLFSSYVFLRLGADYPWPFHELNPLPGFINTMVLIASSVTVVAAWAALKARRYGWYKINMLITLACALAFMCIKSYEYYGKFTHYSLEFTDGSVISGHPVHDPHDQPGTTWGDHIVFGDVKSIIIDLERGNLEFLDSRRVAKGNAPYAKPEKDQELRFKTPATGEITLNKGWLKQKHREYMDARAELTRTITALELEKPRLNPKDDPGVKLEKDEKIAAINARIDKANAEFIASGRQKDLTASVKLDVIGDPLVFLVKERNLMRYGQTELAFREGTTLQGKLVTDKIQFHVDLIDLRKMKKDHEQSLVWNHLGELKAPFLKYRDSKMAEFREDHPKIAEPEKSVDAQRSAYRVEFKNNGEEFISKDAAKKYYEETEIEVPRSEKRFFSNFSPSLSPYYAIYFLMTGLHGLHVVGGAIVLGWFLLTGRKMYLSNPEHLANRVEVGGLFWHFVDLVWIFLFPVFYLL